MFENLKYKVADTLEKIFIIIGKNKEEQRQKIMAKRNTYLEQQRRKNDQKTKEEITKRNQKAKESHMQLRRTFTTIAEYKKIAGNRCSLLDKLPRHERDMIAVRVQKLCEKDVQFRKDLEAWAKQGYEIPEKNRPMTKINPKNGNVIQV